MRFDRTSGVVNIANALILSGLTWLLIHVASPVKFPKEFALHSCSPASEVPSFYDVFYCPWTSCSSRKVQKTNTKQKKDINWRSALYKTRRSTNHVSSKPRSLSSQSAKHMSACSFVSKPINTTTTASERQDNFNTINICTMVASSHDLLLRMSSPQVLP